MKISIRTKFIFFACGAIFLTGSCVYFYHLYATIEGAMPILMRDGKLFGIFHIGMSGNLHLADLWEDALWSLLITLVCMLGAAALVWSFTRKLLTDVHVIADTARSIGLGNLTARVALERQDELGALGDSINLMADALRQSLDAQAVADEQVRAVNLELEAQVERRTAQLQKAKENLEHEIVERELIERELRQSETLFRSVIEGGVNGILMADARGKIILVNARVEELFGYPRDELIGQSVDMLVPKAARAGHAALREGFSVDGQRRVMGLGPELCGRRKDGSEITIEIGLNPIETELGRFTIAVIVDMSERQRVMASLRESEARQRAVVETAQAIIWETDTLTWKFSFVSQGTEAILGYPVRRWLAEPHFWPMIIHTADRAMVLEASREQARAGLDHELEYRVRAADGRIVWLKDIVRVVKDAEGKVVGLRGIKIDITGRKHIEEHLSQSLSDMTFIQGVSWKLVVADNIASALDEILRECLVRGDFDIGTILLADEQGDGAEVVASHGYRDPQNVPRRKRVGNEEMPRFRTRNRSGATLYQNLQTSEGLRSLKKEGAQSALIVPIGQGESPIGLLQLATRGKIAIDERLIPLMETIGLQIGMSLQKTRLLNETQRNLKRASALHEINLAATSTLDLKEILDVLIDKVVQLLPFTVGITVRLRNRVTGQMEFAVCRGIAEKELLTITANGKAPFSARVVERREVLAIADVSDHQDCPDPEFYRSRGYVSYLGVPLINQNEVLGVMAMITRERREFTADEIDFMQLIAGQAAMAIHNANLYGDLKKQATQLEAAREVEASSRADSELLASVSHEILAAGENEAWLETVLWKCAEAGGFELGTILLLENDDGAARSVVASYGYRERPNRQREMRRIAADDKSQRETLDFDRTTIWENLHETDRLRILQAEGARFALMVPIKRGARSMGLLQLASRSSSKMDNPKIQLFETVAEQIAVGIEKSALLRETRQNFTRIAALHEMHVAVTSTLELDQVLQLVLGKIEQVVPYAVSVTIKLVQPKTGRLELTTFANIDPEAIKQFAVSGKPTLSELVAQRRQPLLIPDLQSHPDCPDPDLCRKHGWQSYLGMPLMVREQLVGVLSLSTSERRDFSKEEIDFILLLTGQAAMAIHNAQLFENIREQKAAIENAKEIEAAAAAKSRFLAMMSHEIRTPLNAVIGLTDILLCSELTEDQRKMTETINASGANLLLTINDILDFSKLEAEKVTIELRDFNLSEAAKSAVNIIDHEAKAKGLRLKLGMAGDVPAIVTGDAGRLRQILFNLLSNAIKFTERGEIGVNVTVAEEKSDGVSIKFAVSDQGIGISAEAQTRLFQPFSQADNSTTRRFGGTGLGLSISKRLAELMGGSMGVESEEGKGSTFWFTLFARRVTQPLAAPTPLANDPAVEAKKLNLRSDARILLVEDNSVNRMIAMRMLKLLGLRADVAADGVEAVDATERQSYDLLLMDCEMPNLDGYQATAQIRLREADSGTRTRIVAMTANAMSGDREKCLEAGMDDYLAKPVQLADLKAALERCL